MCRPISGSIHIDLEGEGDQNQNNAENIVIATANQNEENQDVAEPETVNEDVEDMIIGKQSSIIVREEVTNNSDDDFVNPAQWSKSKGKQKNVTVREEVTNDSDDDFVNPAPWSKNKGNVKRKLVMEDKDDGGPNKKRKEKNTKDKEEGTLRLIDEETDEDLPEAQILHDKEARLKGKRKPSENSNEDDKAKKRRGKQKIEERTEIANKEDEIAKIRNSPRLLSDMICALSDEQMQWVKDVGFGSLLDFELVEMPQRLAYKIIEAFDEKTCRLILKRGDIEINEQVVHDVLGLPCRGAEIKFAKDCLRSKRTIEWRSQFPGNNELQSLIKASEVILYVDRVCCQGKQFVPRRYPAFKGWTKEKIKERELLEAEEKAFGSGNILKMVTVEELEANEKLVLKEKLNVEEEKGGAEIEKGVEDDNRQNPDGPHEEKLNAEEEKGGAEIEKGVKDDNRQNPDGPHEDWWKDLNMKAVFLIDANIQLTEAKTEYEAQLANAKNYIQMMRGF
ncbi:hypothetical protein POM88_037198 [Heracleum sosnowskyi]|uniref:Uncharacterized protein n=1 Tax=Heracleum sosnowskyi TaxID=360622 RepID=A0AAD8HPW1_9APIA|nr:hypothetical protein POM88_037198 [Heracleum sosnowskyi]